MVICRVDTLLVFQSPAVCSGTARLSIQWTRLLIGEVGGVVATISSMAKVRAAYQRWWRICLRNARNSPRPSPNTSKNQSANTQPKPRGAIRTHKTQQSQMTPSLDIFREHSKPRLHRRRQHGVLGDAIPNNIPLRGKLRSPGGTSLPCPLSSRGTPSPTSEGEWVSHRTEEQGIGSPSFLRTMEKPSDANL